MFGDLMGQMKDKQKEIRDQLAKITVEAESGNGAVKVTANAKREILNISIDKEAIEWEDVEQVEDLVMVAINRVLALAAEKEKVETERIVQSMLPPGLGDMSGLFK